MRSSAWKALVATALVTVAASTTPVLARGEETTRCGGRAPRVVACRTGTHVVPRQGLSVALTGSNYAGTLETRLLTGRSGGYVQRCDIVSGLRPVCTSRGRLPAPGATFQHQCASYWLGTSEPGGAGGWSCAIAGAGRER